MTNKIPVSAVVVTFNEEKYLEKCLKSINFCEETIVIDLGSTDKSKQIAIDCGAKLIEHERVPVVEMIHSKIEEFVSNKWVLITDPDEITDASLANEIINTFNTKISLDSKIGAVNVPCLFYYKQKRLKGTIWGGVNRRVYLVNTDRFEFSPGVHAGRKLKKGFESYSIKFTGSNAVHHYWMNSFKQLKEKHKRYIKQEGKARYENGKRTNIKNIIKIPYREFKKCFYTRKGYKDKLTGLFLSLFWVWYSLSAEISLLKFQKRQK